MEVLFRKYFWTVNLVFLALLAFLSAKTVNVFTESAISPPPDFTPVASNRPTTFTLPTRLSADALYKATGIEKPEAPEVKEPVVEKPADDLSAEPVHTSLHAKLIGTVVASIPEWSWALIEDTQAHSNDVYMPKDKIQEATVLTIEEDRVIVVHDGHREIIDRTDGTGPVAVAAPPPPSGPDIHEVNEGNYTIARSEVDRALNNLNELAMQARIVPAFKDGKATGFKLFSIRPDSLYSKIGIQNGDVISRINGFEINSPDKALEAYSKLKDASAIQLEIDRNGSTVSKNYQIQ